MKWFGALLLVLSLAVPMTACQAPPEGQRERQPASPPASVQASPDAQESTGPASPASSPAQPVPETTAPALSAEAQAQLDQELIAAAKANNAPLVKELIARGAT